jgi:hypothetical protein
MNQPADALLPLHAISLKNEARMMRYMALLPSKKASLSTMDRERVPVN